MQKNINWIIHVFIMSLVLPKPHSITVVGSISLCAPSRGNYICHYKVHVLLLFKRLFLLCALKASKFVSAHNLLIGHYLSLSCSSND